MKISKKVSNFFGGLFTISLATSIFCFGVRADELTLLDEPNVATQSVSANESADNSNCDQQKFPSVKIRNIASIRLRRTERGLGSGNITWDFEAYGNNIFEKHRKLLEDLDLEVERLISDSPNTIDDYIGDSKKAVIIMNFYDNSDKNTAALPSDDKPVSDDTNSNIDNDCEIRASGSDAISEQAANIIEQI